MTFDELLDRKPHLLLADFIQLCLMGQDDKIYIDVDVYKGGKLNLDEWLENKRIIDKELAQYYDCEIIGIYEINRLVIQIKK